MNFLFSQNPLELKKTIADFYNNVYYSYSPTPVLRAENIKIRNVGCETIYDSFPSGLYFFGDIRSIYNYSPVPTDLKYVSFNLFKSGVNDPLLTHVIPVYPRVQFDADEHNFFTMFNVISGDLTHFNINLKGVFFTISQ